MRMFVQPNGSRTRSCHGSVLFTGLCGGGDAELLTIFQCGSSRPRALMCTGAASCNQKNASSLFSTFPMVVPSLSWQNDWFYT